MGIVSKPVMLLFALAAFASETCLAERNDVLVIVNDNSNDSLQVGEHYAAQRGIPASNVVHIRSPNQYFISWTEFESLRDQILRFGICPSLPSTQRPAACSDSTLPIYTEANVDVLAMATPIRYVVTTRGVPTRLTAVPPSSDSLPPVDNLLRVRLARFFAVDTPINQLFPSSVSEREKSFGNGDGMRNVIPAQDREFAIGRVDGVNLSSTIALINRTISAEQDGIYGKTFASVGQVSTWMDSTTGINVYPGAGASWRYLLGLFNESRPECSDYANPSNYLQFGQGNSQSLDHSPGYCSVQFRKAGDKAPGHTASRQPMPVGAQVYISDLVDSQTLDQGFAELKQWRHTANCTALCADIPDPAASAACHAASTDPVGEINTACVGVEPGFIGYQYRSYPVSYLGIWPTKWVGPNGGGTKVDVPRVDRTRGYDDSYSLWYDRPDEPANAQCYAYSNGILSDALQNCKSSRLVRLQNSLKVTGNNGANPSLYQFQFRYRTESLPSTSNLTARVVFAYPKPASTPCPTGLSGAIDSRECTFVDSKNYSLAAGSSNEWVLLDRSISPPINNEGMNYTTIRIEFEGAIASGGNLGLDTVSLVDTGTNIQLLENGSFSNGHQQTSTGDLAAVFIGRLGGTAFWGSTSHYVHGGHAFNQQSLETLVYFMRGLPLAEAVWVSEKTPDGMLYGDPLYAPVAVRILPFSSNYWRRVNPSSSIALAGSTINGRGTAVDTTYSLHYCKGSDFYLCGTSDKPWLTTGIENRPGKFENQSLGTWDTSNIEPGAYTLRLAVTSSHGGKTTTINDFMPAYFVTPTTDIDGDGLADTYEMANGINPDLVDTDGDWLTDGQEVLAFHTSPTNKDSDGNGIIDSWEDADNDGYANYQEMGAFGGDPFDSSIIPLAFLDPKYHEVKTGVPFSAQLRASWPDAKFRFKSTVIPEGMTLTSSGLLTWTPAYNYPYTNGGMLFLELEAYHPSLTSAVNLWHYFKISCGHPSDINGNQSVDVADAVLLQRHILGLPPTLGFRKKDCADLAPLGSPDGILDAADLQALIDKILNTR